MAVHGQSAWIKDLHSDKVKGRYHINALILFNEGKEVGRRKEEWKSIAALNNKARREVKEYMEQRREEMKDKSETNEEDGKDSNYEKHHLGFPMTYGDEEEFGYWKGKAVNLNKLIEERYDQLPQPYNK